MKKLLLALCLLTVFACSIGSVPYADDARVQEFMKIYPEASIDTEKYKDADSRFVKEFLSNECTIAAPFDRILYEQYGAMLVLYVKDKEIKCAVSKIDTTPVVIEQGTEGPENVALMVNGNPVLLDRIGAALATYPSDQQGIATINTVIDQIITQELLMQEAQGYAITEKEAYEIFLEANTLNEQEVMARLVEQNTTLVAFKSQLLDQAKLEALLEEKLGAVMTTEEDTRAYYLGNTDLFIVSEQVTFQQVFVNTVRYPNQDALNSRINTILRSLNSTDFCTVVKEYSDDAESKERCGVYTIPRGVVQPSIEQTAFTAEIGELIAVNSEAGLHIINVLERKPTTVLRYDQVQSEVEGLLRNQIYQLRLNAYLATLRSNANVVSFLTVQQNTPNAAQ